MKYGAVALVLIGSVIIAMGVTGSQKKTCQAIFGGNCDWIPGASLHESTCTPATANNPGNCSSGNTGNSNTGNNVDNFFNQIITGNSGEGTIQTTTIPTLPVGVTGGVKL